MKKPTKQNAENAPERVVERTDNNPPEAISLVAAGEIPDAHKDAVKKLEGEHLQTFLTYLRVPEVIETKDVYDRVTALAVAVKKAHDAIDKARTAAKKPYLDGGTAVDKAYEIPVVVDVPATTESEAGKKTVNMRPELKTAHASLKARLSAYDTAEYLKSEEKRIAEQTAVANAAAGDGIVMEVAQTGGGSLQSARSGYGGNAIRNVKKTFRVIDASKVPASMCSPDPDKIQAAIDAGATEIAGIEIDVEVVTHVR